MNPREDTGRREGGASNRRPGRAYSAHFHLLDRQVVDREGRPVCKVDDLELAHDEHGRPYVTALLAGPAALAPRLGGLSARWLAAVQRRMSVGGGGGPARIDFGRVTGIGPVLTVDLPEGAAGVHALEDWMRDEIVARLPGAGRASG